MNTREKAQAKQLIRPQGDVRRLSAASLVMLDLLGNPLAELNTAESKLYHLAEYAWLHAEQEDVVRSLVVEHEEGSKAVKQAVLAWAANKTEAQVATMVRAIRQEVEETAQSIAIGEDDTPAKNESGPCSQLP